MMNAADTTQSVGQTNETKEEQRKTQPRRQVDPEIRKAIQRAKTAQELRKKVPMTTAIGDIVIPQDRIIETIRRSYLERGQEPPHIIGVEMNKLRDYSERGYQPELDRFGEPYIYEGLIFVSCPESMYQAGLKATVSAAKRRFQGAVENLRDEVRPLGSTVSIRETRVPGPKA